MIFFLLLSDVLLCIQDKGGNIIWLNSSFQVQEKTVKILKNVKYVFRFLFYTNRKKNPVVRTSIFTFFSPHLWGVWVQEKMAIGTYIEKLHKTFKFLCHRKIILWDNNFEFRFFFTSFSGLGKQILDLFFLFPQIGTHIYSRLIFLNNICVC